jgi:hypothetical protein
MFVSCVCCAFCGQRSLRRARHSSSELSVPRGELRFTKEILKSQFSGSAEEKRKNV